MVWGMFCHQLRIYADILHTYIYQNQYLSDMVTLLIAIYNVRICVRRWGGWIVLVVVVLLVVVMQQRKNITSQGQWAEAAHHCGEEHWRMICGRFRSISILMMLCFQLICIHVRLWGRNTDGMLCGWKSMDINV